MVALPLLPPPLLLLISSLASPEPSYFSSKKNVFNVYFVKVLWAWTTVAFILLRPRRNAIVRYSIFTVYWFIITQWFFGPAIIDRGFRISGGRCEGMETYSSIECRLKGGKWVGGHDISGHVFLLSIASVFLWMEALVSGKTSQVERGILTDELNQATVLETRSGARYVTNDTVSSVDSPQPSSLSSYSVPQQFAFAISALSLLMLMMTAVYFHTAFEKVYSYESNVGFAGFLTLLQISGLIVAYLGLFIVYILPRTQAVLQKYIGMPF